MSNERNLNPKPIQKKNPLLNVVLPIMMLLAFLGLIAVASYKLMGTRNDDYAEKVKLRLEQQEAAKQETTTATKEVKAVEKS